LRRLKPLAFVSRDDVTYAAYQHAVRNSHPGIDCAFFLPDAYKPFRLALPDYVVAAFDACPEPRLDAKGRLLVRAHHQIYEAAPRAWVDTDNTLISDIPQDYLTLYANAQEVHSDRVHACVASLAYGGAARLYNSTPRGSLLDCAGAYGIREDLAKLDMGMLAQKKNAQVAYVREVVSKHFDQ